MFEKLDGHEAPAIKSGAELLASVPVLSRARFDERLQRLRESAALNLLTGLQTATDPAKFWTLHLEFHRRGIPPVLRGPRHAPGSPQFDFLDLCADLLWLQSQWPYHKPKYKSARRLFAAIPDSREWHQLALVFFNSLACTRTRVIALDLESHQRHELRNLADAATRHRYSSLHGKGGARLFSALIQSLTERPDKSGQTDPRQVALRRSLLWRIHQLTGRNCQRTAEHYFALTGLEISRQVVARQIEATAPIATKVERLHRLDTEPPPSSP